MRMYCGIDLGNKRTAVCVMSESGEVVRECEVATEAQALRRALKGEEKLCCVVEASPLAEWMCEVVESCGHRVEVLDPRHAKAVTHSRKKTDRLDARKLAHLARTGWYTAVHRKSGQSREVRSYLVARKQLVEIATKLSNAIRGILRAHGLQVSTGERFEASVKVATATLPVFLQDAIAKLLVQWRMAHREQAAMYRALAKLTRARKDCSLLMTIPGVGPATAAAFAATIENPKRFESSEKVASYLGLVPRVHQSGETEYRGRITKQGDPLLRWLLIEAAGVLLTRVKHDHPLKRWGLALREAKGLGKAKVAVARKIACLMWHVWSSEKPYVSQEPAASTAA